MCVRVWAVIPADLGSRNEHIYTLKNVAIHSMLRRGQGNPASPHFPGVQRQPRSHGIYPLQRQKSVQQILLCMIV